MASKGATPNQTMWIRIAKDPMDKHVVPAMALGKYKGTEYGTIFAGFARQVPDDWFEQEGWDRVKRWFDIVDDSDVTDEERHAESHNLDRVRQVAKLAKEAKAIREENRRKREAAAKAES